MKALSINQVLKLVVASGMHKTYIVEGPMGSGKSSIVEMARRKFGDKYHYVVVDCTQWDVGDVQIPDVDKVEQVTRFIPNVLLVGDGTKPMFILLDEIGKASRSVQNALLPVMLERRAGMRKLPEGSIVCAATNFGAEGVGDLFQPHARNRVSFIEMGHPTVDAWIEDFALHNDVPAAVMVWARENPQIFNTFKQHEKPDSNPYIFHPKEQRRSFVTPRSLYLASIELRDDVRAAVDDPDATLAAVAGNIGQRAALDLMAWVALADKMPSWSLITSDPENAPIPKDSPAAMCLAMFSAVAKVERDTFPAVLKYIKRMPAEIQHMFAQNIMRLQSKQAWAALHRPFTEWVAANHWMMVKH